MKEEISKLGIKKFNFDENSFRDGDDKWSVYDLIELSEKYKPFDLPLAGIDLSGKPWGDISVKGFAYHMIRVNDADLKYPIILDDEGYICDGWHRLVKAIINGDATIKAIRLPIMPKTI